MRFEEVWIFHFVNASTLCQIFNCCRYNNINWKKVTFFVVVFCHVLLYVRGFECDCLWLSPPPLKTSVSTIYYTTGQERSNKEMTRAMQASPHRNCVNMKSIFGIEFYTLHLLNSILVFSRTSSSVYEFLGTHARVSQKCNQVRASVSLLRCCSSRVRLFIYHFIWLKKMPKIAVYFLTVYYLFVEYQLKHILRVYIKVELTHIMFKFMYMFCQLYFL